MRVFVWCHVLLVPRRPVRACTGIRCVCSLEVVHNRLGFLARIRYQGELFVENWAGELEDGGPSKSRVHPPLVPRRKSPPRARRPPLQPLILLPNPLKPKNRLAEYHYHPPHPCRARSPYIRGGGVRVLRFLAILGSAAQVRIGTLDCKFDPGCKFDPNPNRDTACTSLQVWSSVEVW